MKFSVFGQRSITDAEQIIAILEANMDLGEIPTFLYGGAKGPQQIIYEYLRDLGTCDIVLFQPWTMVSKRLAKEASKDGKYDPTYFFFRNIQIVDNSDVVIFFDNGEQDAEVYKVRRLCERKEKAFLVIEVK